MSGSKVAVRGHLVRIKEDLCPFLYKVICVFEILMTKKLFNDQCMPNGLPFSIDWNRFDIPFLKQFQSTYLVGCFRLTLFLEN